ncbi:hypothetical protein ASPSYDRAFT_137531 [Aspergillus sydowii CBS 593.65]|uniref:Uncharacterized protein n=1 Tax=Aspergillus sydowii CBS 593.65 TaxID=1036612 RepID=A0A1L9T0K9_9EURO|nr:uncharacterized protein ASPSYDRAFT_137531 [Aspergillus sydowii CBS 593.65]OJJ52956.1 hypothetical protein ASPSYDRAFT_137531 [Aspergillus sydowii CBS 593.65]
MRLALWAPALATAAAAMPGTSSGIVASSSATPTSSSTPESTSSDVSSEFEQGSMKRVCQNKGDPAEDWEEFKMGEFLNQTVADRAEQLNRVVQQRQAVQRQQVRHVLAQEALFESQVSL